MAAASPEMRNALHEAERILGVGMTYVARSQDGTHKIGRFDRTKPVLVTGRSWAEALAKLKETS